MEGQDNLEDELGGLEEDMGDDGLNVIEENEDLQESEEEEEE